MESLNQLVEARSGTGWLALGIGGALALGGSTVFLVGTADMVAAGGAIVFGLGGLAAAGWRGHLAGLPLELAPVVARSVTPLGSDTTVRCRLGRGRRVLSLDVVVLDGEGRPLQVLVPPTPLVGRFQVVVLGDPEALDVTVTATDAGGRHTVQRRYGSEAIVPGRFAAGVGLRGRRLALEPGSWDVVDPVGG